MCLVEEKPITKEGANARRIDVPGARCWVNFEKECSRSMCCYDAAAKACFQYWLSGAEMGSQKPMTREKMIRFLTKKLEELESAQT